MKQKNTPGRNGLFICLTLVLIFSERVNAQAKITFSEINYASKHYLISENNSDSNSSPMDWVELWNYGNTAVDVSNWVFQNEKFQEFYVIPQGVVLSPDGRIVLARDKTRFQEFFPDVEVYGSFSFNLSGKGQIMRLYDQNSQLYLEMNYTDTFPWPKTPDGYGTTLELIDPEGDLSDATNWFAGCILGSPGEPHTPCKQKLIFTEVQTSSDPPIEDGNWIELRNISSEPVDISGWTFKDRKRIPGEHEFTMAPNTVIQPGYHLVLNSKNKFEDYYRYVDHQGPFDFGLRTSGEVVRLYDENGVIYTCAYWYQTPPWPTKQGSGNITLELKDDTARILYTAENWFDGCPGGSPGDYYDPACPYQFTSVNETVTSGTHDKVYPNPFNKAATIEAKANHTNEVVLTVYDYTGKIMVNQHISNHSETSTSGKGMIKINFERQDLPPGIYLYSLTQNDAVIGRGKMVISN